MLENEEAEDWYGGNIKQERRPYNKLIMTLLVMTLFIMTILITQNTVDITCDEITHY